MEQHGAPVIHRFQGLGKNNTDVPLLGPAIALRAPLTLAFQPLLDACFSKKMAALERNDAVLAGASPWLKADGTCGPIVI